MYYTQGKTQVYSPFGSFVVEQHDTGFLQRYIDDSASARSEVGERPPTSAGFRRRAPRGLTDRFPQLLSLACHDLPRRLSRGSCLLAPIRLAPFRRRDGINF